MAARDSLLERVLDDIAREGLLDASLRELAARVGTSHRMLLYHFGSRDGLIAAIATAVEAQQTAQFERLAATTASPRDLALAMWRNVSAPAVLPFVRIFFEVVPYAIQGRPGSEEFRNGFVARWLELDSITPQTRAEIRVGIAVVRGLLLELLVTGDRATADDAMRRYAATLGRTRVARSTRRDGNRRDDDRRPGRVDPPGTAPDRPAFDTRRGRG